MPRYNEAAMDRLRYKKANALVLHFADDFGGQTFHLFSVVEEEVELDELGSRVGDLAQTCDAGGRWAIDGDSGQTRNAVDALESGVDTFAGAGYVVIDDDVDAFGNREGGGVLL